MDAWVKRLSFVAFGFLYSTHMDLSYRSTSDSFRFQISNYHKTVAKLSFFCSHAAPVVVTNFEFEFSNDIFLKTSWSYLSGTMLILSRNPVAVAQWGCGCNDILTFFVGIRIFVDPVTSTVRTILATSPLLEVWLHHLAPNRGIWPQKTAYIDPPCTATAKRWAI